MVRPDVVHLLFGGLGGQHRLVVDLAAGFASVGLRTMAVSYATAGQALDDHREWPAVDRLEFVEKRRGLDVAAASRLADVLAGSGARALVWHSAYAPIAVSRLRRNQSFSAVVYVEHQSVGIRRVAEDLRSAVGIRVADRTVLLSQDYRSRHPLRRLGLRGLSEAAVVTNGVDTDQFAPFPGRRSSREAQHRAVIVGRLVPSRSIAVAVRAVHLLLERGMDLQLEILGDGPGRRSLQEQVRRLGLDDAISLPGRVPVAAVAERLRMASLYLHPSLGEARSTALLQAWAAGLPVVASRVAGIEDLIRDGEDGLLVPASDAAAMADGVARLIRDPDLAARLGASGRARAVTEHSITSTVRGYLEVLAGADPSGPWADALGRIRT